ncbi:hypothetical protein FA95DRAFT_1136275 [Auriscalpium vulgare]|uniref:Uncharacterized protein n=1 Tax=Auriscalpium vulgare TaxID=40419 RepID=A0ACB8R5K7_9AGAM|nr:hypothetical protein FA95DRAFT_1136275 [Auriscalpium vulgare]
MRGCGQERRARARGSCGEGERGRKGKRPKLARGPFSLPIILLANQLSSTPDLCSLRAVDRTFSSAGAFRTVSATNRRDKRARPPGVKYDLAPLDAGYGSDALVDLADLRLVSHPTRRLPLQHALLPPSTPAARTEPTNLAPVHDALYASPALVHRRSQHRARPGPHGRHKRCAGRASGILAVRGQGRTDTAASMSLLRGCSGWSGSTWGMGGQCALGVPHAYGCAGCVGGRGVGERGAVRVRARACIAARDEVYGRTHHATRLSVYFVHHPQTKYRRARCAEHLRHPMRFLPITVPSTVLVGGRPRIDVGKPSAQELAQHHFHRPSTQHPHQTRAVVSDDRLRDKV